MVGTSGQSVGELRARAATSLMRLRGVSGEDLAAMKADLVALRDTRQHDLMAKLAEAMSRSDPDDAGIRKLYAQCMIETGYCTAAIEVLRQTAARLSPEHSEWAEVYGLIGRASKQIVCDAGDKSTSAVRSWLEQAIAAYKLPW